MSPVSAVDLDAIIPALEALAHPTRLALVRLLAGGGEVSAGVLAAQVDQPPGRISVHLNVLLGAGLVARRSEGTRKLYRLVPAPLVATAEAIFDLASPREAAGAA